ncbi:MAG: lysylphosphatidylglycerol synthase domain-containing protein [Thermodesulfobacteriota bacterium]|nr:lysylphosphatidylglycerol synthase domain-containing protein [Thermodesulfobacteriota bacterium]MEE2975520.1 lysylphosphatidylglycerol synthase domain-containing protein [Thermodesulfobacteriota bacterium]|tara:strand:+ start:11671 stop:12645 length:975 start_codon:yes stop_codon:yes gene_type:complete
MITAENEKKVKLKKQITQILGWVISAVALYFVYHYVVQIDLEAAKAKLNIYWIPFVLVFIAIYVCLMSFLANGWRYVLELLHGSPLPKWRFIGIYTKTQIYKYIPSNLMHVIARIYFATKLGPSKRNVVQSYFLEIVFMVLIGLLIVGTCTYAGVFSVSDELIVKIKEFSGGKLKGFSLGILGFGAIAIGFYLYKAFRNFDTSFSSENLLKIGKLILLLLGFFAGMGLVEYIVFANLLGMDVGYFYILALFTITWLGMFIIPGAPGGIGIREFIVITLLAPIYGPDDPTIGILVFRVVTVVGDALLLPIGNIFLPEDISEAKEV